MTLKIKPQISEGGGVKMLIAQEVSSVAPTGAQGAVTNKRSIDIPPLSPMTAHIVVLGGLIEETGHRERAPFRF